MNAVYNVNAKNVNAKVAEYLGLTATGGKFVINGEVGEDTVEFDKQKVRFEVIQSAIEGFPLLKMHTYTFEINGEVRVYADPQPLSPKGCLDKAFWLVHRLVKAELGITRVFSKKADPVKKATLEQLRAHRASKKVVIKKEETKVDNF